MELPIEIQEILEKKIVNIKSKYLNEIFDKLSNDYIKNTGTGKEFLLNKDYVLVYALSRFNATFSVVDFVLNKFDEYIKQDIETLLDVGGGMAIATINALYHFNIQNVDIIERNKNMIELGKEFLSKYDINYQYINQDVNNFSSNKKYDMVICSYFLSELNENNRLKVVKKLLENTEKYLVIVDIGTPQGYKNILQIKKLLTNSGAKVMLPCPNADCPLDNNDWCHFVTRVNRTKINKLVKNAVVPYEDEKFCYLIIGKENSFLQNNVVLRHPIKEKNKVDLVVCEKGSIKNYSINKKDLLYKKARKIKIGDELKVDKD